MFRQAFFWITLALGVAGLRGQSPTPSERHVVIVVWDGMRPDFVTAEHTPTLWKLGQDGVLFTNHHPVYFSATNVNGTALATGMYPSHSDLIANVEFRPLIDGHKPIDVSNVEAIKRGDEVSHDNYISAPTVAELVQKAGGRSVIAASKTVGVLHDRPRLAEFANRSVTLAAGTAWPNEATSLIEKALGPFPIEHNDRDVWTTRALTEVLWKDGVPPFSVLWLGQPDLTQHETAPGSDEALRAMKASDTNLATVLAALDRYGIRQSTDIFIVSDHGFSTIEREVDLPRILADAGFKVSTEFKTEPAPGKIMLVGGGGSVLFYVVNHESAVVNRLIEFLQKSDFAGVIFARNPAEGTFSLDQAKIDSRDAPDVVMAFRWNDRPNQHGVPGMIDGDWQRGAGKGTHATLSRFDMHNTLVAAGPDLQRGKSDNLPTGNVDLAPTVLSILKIPVANKMDGRVLDEALITGGAPAKPETQTIEATRRFPTGVWRQSLRVSRVGTTVYLDEGNGSFTPAK
ncbi:MAG TPA: alkaline phosphatase family protein [Chthoniobacterales bacterium]|jgi:predicted AlkP superfamily pyrophosphatase or phosphodiesterase